MFSSWIVLMMVAHEDGGGLLSARFMRNCREQRQELLVAVAAPTDLKIMKELLSPAGGATVHITLRSAECMPALVEAYPGPIHVDKYCPRDPIGSIKEEMNEV